MRISVQQRGGAFGIDRHVEVDGGEVRVLDEPAAPATATLDPSDTDAIERLAAVVKGATVEAASGAVYDQMTTVIEIDDGASRSEIVVRSGDQAPAEVWELVELVKGAGGRTGRPG